MFMCVTLVFKFVWGTISKFHTQTKQLLEVFVESRALKRIKTSGEAKLHRKVVKAMKPVAFPVGIWNYTFFFAKQSNELLVMMFFVDNAISLLLIG